MSVEEANDDSGGVDNGGDINGEDKMVDAHETEGVRFLFC